MGNRGEHLPCRQIIFVFAVIVGVCLIQLLSCFSDKSVALSANGVDAPSIAVTSMPFATPETDLSASSSLLPFAQ